MASAGLLVGKTAIVTGGASGIGAAVARLFARHGAHVALFDLDREAAQGVSADLPNALALECDVSDPSAVEAAFDDVVAQWGRLDLVAHIAGVDDPVAKTAIAAATRSGAPLDLTENLPDDRWRRILSVNLDGSFYVTRAALRRMPGPSGSIVLMSSIAGVTGVGGLAHYSASKAGVIGLARAVAKEVVSRGIRVNAVAPAGVDTPMMQRGAGEMAESGAVPMPPMGRVATAEEIADTVLFLASDMSTYITGEVVRVTGGGFVG